MNLFRRRALYALLPIFLCSACSSKKDTWITTPLTDTQIKRHFYQPEGLVASYSFDVVETPDHIYGYLNIHQSPRPPGTIPIRYQVDEKEWMCLGTVLEGGQKILLPEEDTVRIQQAKSFTVY